MKLDKWIEPSRRQRAALRQPVRGTMDALNQQAAISNHTIMAQVRKNLVFELAGDCTDNELLRRELMQMLAREPMDVEPEVMQRLLDRREPEVGFVRMTFPYLKQDNPRPRLSSWRPSDIKGYLARLTRYHAVNWLAYLLPRVLDFRHETRAFLMMGSFSSASDDAIATAKAQREVLQ